METMRRCRADEQAAMVRIINDAAERYRGVIPADCWHEPYMPAEELAQEIAAGVEFWGIERDGALVGVMGIQPVQDVALIRHAYVLPGEQGRGVGGRLLETLCAAAGRTVLVGTWAAAEWAIGLYRRHGFALVEREETPALLRRYWTVAERQIELSVVLARMEQPG
jgi:N-acetylglutamate synthase-like GNAT family acetyltransferase